MFPYEISIYAQCRLENKLSQATRKPMTRPEVVRASPDVARAGPKYHRANSTVSLIKQIGCDVSRVDKV